MKLLRLKDKYINILQNKMKKIRLVLKEKLTDIRRVRASSII